MKSRDQLKLEIKQSLGAPTINIELDESHYEYSINRAVDYYHKFAYGKGVYKDYILLSATSGVSAYPLSDDIREVIDTRFNDTIGGNVNTLFTAENLLWNMGYLNVWNWLDGGMGLVSYELALQYIDLIEQMMPSKYFLTYIREANILTITPTPVRDQLYMAEVYRDVSATYLYDEPWIFEWSKAEAMEILGTIRSKYTSLPGPGGTIMLDGTAMLGFAASEKIRLRTELLTQESDPLMFFLG